MKISKGYSKGFEVLIFFLSFSFLFFCAKIIREAKISSLEENDYANSYSILYPKVFNLWSVFFFGFSLYLPPFLFTFQTLIRKYRNMCMYINVFPRTYVMRIYLRHKLQFLSVDLFVTSWLPTQVNQSWWNFATMLNLHTVQLYVAN